MSEKVDAWYSNCYNQCLDEVGSMSREDVNLCENRICSWLFGDGMEPLIRSGFLENVSALDLSKALTNVLKRQQAT